MGAAERPERDASGGRGGTAERPSAWVPASGARGTTADADRGVVLAYLLAGTGFLLAYLLLLVLSAFEGLGRSGSSVPSLVDLRQVILGLGWLGLTLSGLLVWLVPVYSGVALRPSWLLRVHCPVETLLLVGLLLGSLFLGPLSAVTNLLLILAALAYALLAVPLLRALLLALGDWREGLG